jgi:hypothetical protein
MLIGGQKDGDPILVGSTPIKEAGEIELPCIKIRRK